MIKILPVLGSTKIMRPQKMSDKNIRRTKIFVGQKYSSDKIFVGQKYSSDKIFVTSRKFRQFCPTKFCPIRYNMTCVCGSVRPFVCYPRYLRIAWTDFYGIFRKFQTYANLARDIFGFLKNCFFGRILGKKGMK